MENSKAKFILFIIFFSAFFMVLPQASDAVILYLQPDSGEYHSGDIFIEEIRIDTEGECINVVEANLNFSQDILEAVDFSRGDSILTLWITTPMIDQSKGEVSFIGGIPGEYCGRIPGDPGPSNLLGKMIFKVSGPAIKETEKSLAEVKVLESSRVLLSDKLGTEAKLTVQGATFEILAEKVETPEDQWKEELEKDDIPPEPFKIEIAQQPSVFEGKYFVIFSTTDKQTGVDYYEIKEGEGEWKEVESPYLLKDQTLHSIIKVRAVDKAGNARIVQYIAPIKPKISFYLVIILFFVIMGIILWIIRKLQKTNAKKKSF